MVQQRGGVVGQDPHGVGAGIGRVGGPAGAPVVVCDHREVVPVVLHLPGPGGVVGGRAHDQQHRFAGPLHLIEHLDPGG